MSSIILKKTLCSTGSAINANEKLFSFHGSAVSRTIKDQVNEGLDKLHLVESANKLQFEWDEVLGHYVATMNHDFQKVIPVT